MLKRAFWVSLLGGVALVGCSNQPSNAFQLNSSVAEVTEEGTIRLSAELVGQVGKVEFFAGGTRLGEDTEAPFVQDVSLGLDDNGEVAFTARATMGSGSVQTSSTSVRVNISSIQGRVFQSSRSGGNPLAGARVYVTYANQIRDTFSGADGSFRIPLKGKGVNFDLSVVPPAGSPYYEVNYDNVTVADFVSRFGAARQMNVYLPGGPAVVLPGYPARFGCVQGRLLDTDGATPVVSAPAAGAPDRRSPAACDGSVPPGLFTDPPTALVAGETGLVLWGGFRAVTTGAAGRYNMPVRSTNNPFAFEGNLWAGNYDGGTADGSESYWSKYAFVPQVKVFLNSGQVTNQPDLRLEAFDPATNPKVVGFPLAHNTSALAGGGFAFTGATANALSLSTPSYESSVTSAGIQLGQYVDFSAGPRNLRMPRFAAGSQGQTVSITSQALKFNADFSGVLAISNVTQWVNGTNQGRAMTADFMGVAELLAPADGTTDVSRTPKLSWKAVPGANFYGVTVYDGATGAPVWTANTTATSISIYHTKLQPNKVYLWDVYANDQLEMSDVISISPDALQASRYLDLQSLGYRNLQLKSSVVNQYRGELARGFLESQGYVPNTARQGSKFLVNLIERGYRESASETFAFRTGN